MTQQYLHINKMSFRYLVNQEPSIQLGHIYSVESCLKIKENVMKI